ncbi:MAG TPA: phosphoribosylformylglycinamidine synthase subunit PurQ, partial [Gammaproteobacteria bacterium]|nr:phosphoribosylformylglycinamidine synthase subunit PurQ [Gammaproteobacteria bacterium]
ARLNGDKQVRIYHQGNEVFSSPIHNLHRQWSETSFQMQLLRDHPDCARQEFDSLQDINDPGLFLKCNFEVTAPAVSTGSRPRIAILREQGVNGQVEMAAAFHRAGFECIDVHMNDLINGEVSLASFRGIAACGGFSYGDVLGAGGGWAKSILYNPEMREVFEAFFQREDTFGLGVCNGCQMFSHLQELIPGSGHWPRFVRNQSEQFEARLVMAEILPSPSILLRGMEGAKIPVVVAHGEGQVNFREDNPTDNTLAVLRYIDNYGNPATRYPANPNGSAGGLNGFTNEDGRFTIMMPHPERVFLKKQFSWLDPRWIAEDSPWMQLFINARTWLDS